MLRAVRKSKDLFRLITISSCVIALLFLAALAPPASAQLITPTPACAVPPNPPPVLAGQGYAIYPTPPLTYPMPSDRYAVQYRVDNGDWTDAPVNISYYGGSNSSPYLSYSGYARWLTSMSFVSIPARPNAIVQLHVTKLWGGGFLASDGVSVRPSVKAIGVNLENDGSVQLSAFTGPGFSGEQFVLWWNRDAQDAGSIQGLAFFLDPPYDPPTGNKVKPINGPGDLKGDLSAFDTLAFQGTLAIGGSGAHAFVVPSNINNIYLAPGSWVQGKFHFVQSGQGKVRKIYGPGVLDLSRFEYDLRVCNPGSGYADQGYNAVSWEFPLATPDTFVLDGIAITDQNHAATDLLVGGSANNVKTLGWNGVNGGLRLGSSTKVSNVFIRSGDDSLMMWGSSVAISNATVWQNYNGGVVNLGWFDDSTGDGGLIDGLYVVKTDWFTPSNPSWTAATLNNQNNAVFASLMVPGTNFGSIQPPLYKNIFIEDSPQVLFSLKILPPDCNLVGLYGTCPHPVDLTKGSVVKLRVENLFTPASAVQNSIGFQTLPSGFRYAYPQGTINEFSSDYTLTGSMNISLTNIFVKPSNGSWEFLTSNNAASLAQICTNGVDSAPVDQSCTNASNVNIKYAFDPAALFLSLFHLP